MEQSELEALLGRPLTQREVTNKDLYLEIAKSIVEGLLCMSLDVQATPATTSERIFEAREGYSTVFTGMFTDVTDVKINSVASTDYHARFFNDRNTSYKNSIVFDCKLKDKDEVKITAKWGWSELPADLKLLIAQAFANTSKKYSVGDVKSKKVEDFSIVYGDLSNDDKFITENSRVISKYSLCNVAYVRHGRVC